MYQKILVPIDGSAASRRGLTEAIGLANHLHASVQLLHVVDELIIDNTWGVTIHYQQWIETLREGGKTVLENAVAFARAREVAAEPVLVESIGGRAAEAIMNQAQKWSADLIVMGTHGRRGIRRLLMGSDAEMVLRTALVPVLLVRELSETG